MEKEVTKTRIVEKALELFMDSGLRSVTMDDIAGRLGMSKKTIYASFAKKDHLVLAAMEFSCQREKDHVEKVLAKNLNAIEENFEIGHYVVDILNRMHPSIHYDLEKYHPDAWRIFQDHKERFIRDRCIRRNIEKGIAEELYRDTIDPSVISRFYIERIDMIFDPSFFPPREFSFSRVYLELFKYHIRGIASEKGLNVLDQKLEEDELARKV